MPLDGFVSIKVYNIRGEEITTLFNGYSSPGSYIEQWNGKDKYGVDMPSGMYFYRLNAGKYVQTHKMILLK